MNKVRYKTVYWGDPKYKVGTDGSFWSKKRGEWRERKQSPLSRKTPRPTVCVIINGKRKAVLVHNLVLKTFVGPRPLGMEACHFPDRDVTNNNLSNLRWDTRKNNFRDRDRHGKTAKGSRHGMAKLTEKEVKEIRSKFVPGKNAPRNRKADYLAKKHKIDVSMVYLIIKGKNWKHVK